MQIETIKDVLSWTVDFHKNLKECVTHCSKQNQDERARMILNYVSGHEASLERMVEGFLSTANRNALDTWCYDYIGKHPIVEHGHCDSPFKELDTDHIIEKVVNHHAQVIELYEHLYSRVDIDSAKELLETVKNVEKNEIKRMVQTANRFSDM